MAILMYHHIGTCPAGQQESHRGLWVREEAFAAQMQWLKGRGWQTVTLDDVGAHLDGKAQLPRRWVAVTFDDGWRDNYTRALPVLERNGQTATVFLITGKVRQASSQPASDEFLSTEEIRAMLGAGIRFGSHTCTHPKLTGLSDEELRGELDRSRIDLQALTGTDPSWLAYPYGAFSRRVADCAAESGYLGAVSTIRDNRVHPSQRWWLPRVMIMENTTLQRFSYMLSWAYHAVHTWKNRRRWKGLDSGV